MAIDLHPLARSARTIRVLHHTIVDVVELLDADAFSLDGDRVTIRRRPRGCSPAVTWEAALGDWLVSEQGQWSLAADPCSSSPEIDHIIPAPPGARAPQPF